MNSFRFYISLIIIFSIGTGQLKNLQVLDFESERSLMLGYLLIATIRALFVCPFTDIVNNTTNSNNSFFIFSLNFFRKALVM